MSNRLLLNVIVYSFVVVAGCVTQHNSGDSATVTPQNARDADIVARNLRVINEQGKTVCLIHATKAGDGAIDLYDGNGEHKMQLTMIRGETAATTPEFNLIDDDRKTAVRITPGVMFFLPRGDATTPSLILAHDKVLMLNDKASKTVEIASQPSGVVTVYDADGNNPVRLQAAQPTTDPSQPPTTDPTHPPTTVPSEPYDRGGQNALPASPNGITGYPNSYHVHLDGFPQGLNSADIKTIDITFDTGGLDAKKQDGGKLLSDKLDLDDVAAGRVHTQEIHGEFLHSGDTFTDATQVDRVDTGENFYFNSSKPDFDKAAKLVVTGDIYFQIRMDNGQKQYHAGKCTVHIAFNSPSKK